MNQKLKKYRYEIIFVLILIGFVAWIFSKVFDPIIPGAILLSDVIGMAIFIYKFFRGDK